MTEELQDNLPNVYRETGRVVFIHGLLVVIYLTIAITCGMTLVPALSEISGVDWPTSTTFAINSCSFIIKYLLVLLLGVAGVLCGNWKIYSSLLLSSKSLLAMLWRESIVMVLLILTWYTVYGFIAVYLMMLVATTE